MIRLTIYHGLAEYTFDGEGHIDIIGEVKESNDIHMKVNFDKQYHQPLNDFLHNVTSFDRCKVWDNDNKLFCGEYITISRMDGNPLLKVSKISNYI